MDEYKLVETKTGDARAEYILKNNKPLNIYGAKKILEAQQSEIETLKAQVASLVAVPHVCGGAGCRYCDTISEINQQGDNNGN